MSLQLRVIGIGPGDPRQITLEAVDAIADTDVFLILDKGERAAEFTDLRTDLIGRYGKPDCRTVRVPDPPRDRNPADYAAEVRRWHAARVDAVEQALTDVAGSAAILVWGDPALYDSTLRIAGALAERMDLSVKVIPGVTSASALTAAHGIVAHGIGEPVVITPGRRLPEIPDELGNRIVMLDSHLAFTEAARPDDEVFWGADLGTDHQQLISGQVGEVADRIAVARSAAGAERGHVFDIYLLRRSPGA